jgi:hypothetical protein
MGSTALRIEQSFADREPRMKPSKAFQWVKKTKQNNTKHHKNEQQI